MNKKNLSIEKSSLNQFFYKDVKKKDGNLVYRNYKPGDEEGLAEVYNHAFQANIMGSLKTPRIFHWRYIEYPDFKPEQINICEDVEKHKIVGCVIGNVEEFLIGDKIYKIGVINDVSTFPGYWGRGIAKNLMKMAINHFHNENADFAMLSADPNGHARRKIYIPMGFFDSININALFKLNNFATIIKQIPAVIPIVPLFFFIKIPSYINLFKNKIKNDYKIEITHYKASEEFRMCFNEVIKRQYDCFHEITKEEWSWSRNRCPIKMFKPTEIKIRAQNSNKLVAGAIIQSGFMYGTSLGLRIRMGVVKNLFVDEILIEKICKNKIRNNNKKFKRLYIKELKKVYKLLLSAITKVSDQRKNFFTLNLTASNFRNLIWAAINMAWFKFAAATHMVKELKPNVKYPNLKKIFYLDPGEDFGKW
ncbi:MAG: GNAT family N-acetyltransferase [Promethearchaeota archaeon]